MEGKEFKCEALAHRGGIFCEHIGCSDTADFIYHRFYMIAYVAYGDGGHDIGEKTQQVYEGDVFVIAPDTVHRFRSSSHDKFMELFYCYFLPDMQGEIWDALRRDFPEEEDFFCGRRNCLYMKDNANKNIRNLFVQMLDEFNTSPAGYLYVLKSCFTIMMTTVLRKYRAAINNPVYNRNRTVDEIIRYINYHMSYNITVQDIAEAHHLSESYLCRLFKRNTGMTIVQFINKIKIERVMDILRNTDRSVEGIAENVGFGPVYLKALFKKHTGMSMNAYREKYHHKK